MNDLMYEALYEKEQAAARKYWGFDGLKTDYKKGDWVDIMCGDRVRQGCVYSNSITEGCVDVTFLQGSLPCPHHLQDLRPMFGPLSFVASESGTHAYPEFPNGMPVPTTFYKFPIYRTLHTAGPLSGRKNTKKPIHSGSAGGPSAVRRSLRHKKQPDFYVPS